MRQITHEKGENRREQETPPFSLPAEYRDISERFQILISYEESQTECHKLCHLSPETFYLVQSEDCGGDVPHGGQSARQTAHPFTECWGCQSSLELENI